MVANTKTLQSGYTGTGLEGSQHCQHPSTASAGRLTGKWTLRTSSCRLQLAVGLLRSTSGIGNSSNHVAHDNLALTTNRCSEGSESSSTQQQRQRRTYREDAVVRTSSAKIFIRLGPVVAPPPCGSNFRPIRYCCSRPQSTVYRRVSENRACRRLWRRAEVSHQR
jgi:hypothetical protein